ncbi:LPXTG cell wall anchor domain-containing protein, partial [Lactobacillus crispatus]|uniref:LPXTG cell wall anchor domain-containing protein n=1 Tax=Lactobacillus crispatus TaxID=47770 RepID=UPI00076C4B05
TPETTTTTTDPKTPETTTTTTTDPKTPSDKLPDNPGKSGQTVPVNIHIPDGYQLVPGESVPTFYTFKDGNPNQIISCWLIPTNGGQPTTNDHQGQGTPATNTPTNTTPNGNAVTGKLEGNVPNMQTGKTITFQPTTAKDNQLPQTGNDNSLTTVAGIIVSLLTSCLAVLGINKHQG